VSGAPSQPSWAIARWTCQACGARARSPYRPPPGWTRELVCVECQARRSERLRATAEQPPERELVREQPTEAEARRQRVAALVAEGWTHRAIAAELGVDVRTVAAHRAALEGSRAERIRRRRERVRVLVAAGCTTRQVERALGVSRSVVLRDQRALREDAGGGR
jgi:transposase